MAITSYSTARLDDVIEVTVTSDLAATVIYYHWYLDGRYLGITTVPTWRFCLETGEQARVEVIDTDDPDFVAEAAAPEGFPARQVLFWIRSLDTDVAHYRVEQQRAGGDWTLLGRVSVRDGAWSYQYLTPRLDDLVSYAWRIVPVDTAGNAGTPLAFAAETIVRQPDAPDFTVTLDEETGLFTVAE